MIAVIGAGAIGGATAALIAKNGYKVEIVCKYSDLAKKIKSEGLHIFGVGAQGDHRVIMDAVPKVSELSGKKDIVFLATKATDMVEAAEELLPFLNEDSVVVSLQNGICEDKLASILGRERVIGCVVGWGGTMHAPGELEMTSTGEFVIGNIDNKPDDRLKDLKSIMDCVIDVEISNNIIGSLYSKLIINSCITSLGAVCGLYLGEMLANKKVRNIFIAIMEEAMKVADAMQLKVEPYGGRLDYYKFLSGGNWLQNFKRHTMIKIIGMKYKRLKSSSLQSLERGKPTEIDYLNGYICDNGRKHNIPTPINDKIVSIIKDIEAGKKEISMENFNDPVFQEM